MLTYQYKGKKYIYRERELQALRKCNRKENQQRGKGGKVSHPIIKTKKVNICVSQESEREGALAKIETRKLDRWEGDKSTSWWATREGVKRREGKAGNGRWEKSRYFSITVPVFHCNCFLLRGIKVAKSCDSKSNKVTFYQFDQIKCV